jgi:hypothetical protein
MAGEHEHHTYYNDPKRGEKEDELVHTSPHTSSCHNVCINSFYPPNIELSPLHVVERGIISHILKTRLKHLLRASP